MGGVDLADQYTQYYPFYRKSSNWPKKIFFELVEVVKLNAFIPYKKSPNHQPQGRKKQLTHLAFITNIAEGFLSGFSFEFKTGRKSLLPISGRLQSRCFPVDLMSKSWCHVCWKKFKNGAIPKTHQTKYGCRTCSKHLCIPQCFTIFHTMEIY